MTMPSAWPFIEGINNYILNGDLYHALKEAKKLIAHEEMLIERAKASGRLATTPRRARSEKPRSCNPPTVDPNKKGLLAEAFSICRTTQRHPDQPIGKYLVSVVWYSIDVV